MADYVLAHSGKVSLTRVLEGILLTIDRSQYFPKFRYRLLNEKKFYTLLQKGVPEGGPLDADAHAKLFAYHVPSTDEGKNASTSVIGSSADVSAGEPAAKRQKFAEVVQID